MLTLTQPTVKEEAPDDLPREKITSMRNEADENKNSREGLFADDLYVWNLLLLVDKKD